MIGETIPVLGVLTGLVVPIAVFIWLYQEEKGKRAAVIEIAKHLDDPAKVERAAHNAVIGNADEVAQQIRERFHPEDRVMLWFDFFNHDSSRVIANMESFRHSVIPMVES